MSAGSLYVLFLAQFAKEHNRKLRLTIRFIGWLSAGYRLVIGWLSAGYRLAIGWVVTRVF
jgi:hypothetical protein